MLAQVQRTGTVRRGSGNKNLIHCFQKILDFQETGHKFFPTERVGIRTMWLEQQMVTCHGVGNLLFSGDTCTLDCPRTSLQVEPSPAQTPQLSSLAWLPRCRSQPTACDRAGAGPGENMGGRKRFLSHLQRYPSIYKLALIYENTAFKNMHHRKLVWSITRFYARTRSLKGRTDADP